MSTIIVFPGQGSQKRGMAQDFHDTAAAAQAVFEEASDALALDMKALCFEENEQLGLTEFTQPAILTAEIAMFRTLETEYGLSAQHFGGHSLGEYTALVAAGVLRLTDAVRIVRERGRRMQDAVAPGVGAMAAIIQSDLEPAHLEPSLAGLEVDIANHNALNQIVISGATGDVDAAIERFQSTESGARAKVRKLAVSAPFHSRLMRPIESDFQAILSEASFDWNGDASKRVASNTTGRLHDGDTQGLIERLTQQISSTVRWVDNMHTLLDLTPKRIIEIGPGRPLRGFFRGLGERLTDIDLHAITNRTSARQALDSEG